MTALRWIPLTDEHYAALGETTPHRKAALRAELFRLGLACRTRDSSMSAILVPPDLVEKLVAARGGTANVERVPRKMHVRA